MKNKFVIVTPRPNGGGPIVLHLLCSLLIANGYDAKVLYIGPTSAKGYGRLVYWIKYLKWIVLHDVKKALIAKIFKDYDFAYRGRLKGYSYVPVKGYKRKYLPYVDDDTIVIYPDIVYGNPLGAKNVIRWLLYFNRYPNDARAYGEEDLFFAYREIFNDSKLNPTGRIFKLINFDYELYKNYNCEKRNGTCYIIRKGWNRKDLPSKFPGEVIDDLSENKIVELFNRCKYCISYDTQTFYSSIASVCGCISIVVPEIGKTREDYMKNDDKIYGIAYGFDSDEINYAISTRAKLMQQIVEYKSDNNLAISNFIQECNKYFG